jgi:ATP-dependent DNA ligase
MASELSPARRACDKSGVASFNLVRYRHHDESIFLYAFDLIELNGDDLRRDPLESRKATLKMILAKTGSGIRFNEHMESDGETVFRHACTLGLEGIVSKRKDSTYCSGRSPDWLKMKNARCIGGEARSGGGLGERALAVSACASPVKAWQNFL